MKFCIFCGKPPNDKNKEHVIPQWLIELTGDPKRKARFGFNMQWGSEPSPREFSFNKFTFPACEQCNTKYSKLEADAKVAVVKLLNHEATSASELSRFLDWFDKVRVGLWLGFQQLDKNVYDVEPQFHIQRRIGQFDRLLTIERYKTAASRLNFAGADHPAFAHVPSAFSLIINDLHFINVSYGFLVARRLGFPFPSRMSLIPDRQELIMTLLPGRKRLMRPVIQHKLPKHGATLYQPMFPQDLMSDRSEFYNDDYVRGHSLDFKNGVGSVFIEFLGKEVRGLNGAEKVLIDPPAFYGEEEQLIRGVIDVCNWQDWVLETGFDLGDLSREQRKFVKSTISLCLRVNKKFRDHHTVLLKKRGYSK